MGCGLLADAVVGRLGRSRMGRRLGLRCWALARRALMSSAGHLITVQDIMTKYGVCRRTVVRWKQHPDFPPVAMTAADNRVLLVGCRR